MTTFEEEDVHLWKMVRSVSAQIDTLLVEALPDDFRPLLGPALLVSAIREMKKEGADEEGVRNAIERFIYRIEEEPEEKRKGFRIV